MAYYLMVEEGRGQYSPIDITKSSCFMKTSNYKKDYACSLQEIDALTILFKNIDELKIHLINERLLRLELGKKNLSIRNYNKEKYNKVMYDFLYRDSLDYLRDPSKLIRYMRNELNKNNFDLIEKMANHFISYYEVKTTAAEVRYYASISKKDGRIYSHFNDLDNNGDFEIERFVKLLIYKHRERKDGYIEYSNEVEYRNLHEMIAFINNYNSKNNEETLKVDTNIYEQGSLFEQLDDVKKRIYKKDNE